MSKFHLCTRRPCHSDKSKGTSCNCNGNRGGELIDNPSLAAGIPFAASSILFNCELRIPLSTHCRVTKHCEMRKQQRLPTLRRANANFSHGKEVRATRDRVLLRYGEANVRSTGCPRDLFVQRGLREVTVGEGKFGGN